MNICFIGKYPPIQGGVSASSFWQMRELAKKGHILHIVSNAWEVEEDYRQYFTDKDLAFFENAVFSTGGSITHHFTNPFTTPNFIPFTKPYTSKLASKCIEVVRQYSCDLIYAYYMEPYGVAAFLAAQILNIPFYIRHAGSDITRLVDSQELGLLYKAILDRSSRVISVPKSFATVQKLVVDSSKICLLTSDFLPTPEFSDSGLVLDVNQLLSGLDPHVIETKINSWSTVPIDEDCLTIGIYCKAGRSKGIEQVIAALSCLSDLYTKFNVLFILGGPLLGFFQSLVKKAGEKFSARVRFLPFLAPWRIPSFIRRCNVVCSLENNFSVPIHGPRIPLEILSCGSCLMISDELLQKQFFRMKLQSFDNSVIIEEPMDIQNLAAVFRKLIENPSFAKEIGRRGSQLFQTLDVSDPTKFINNFEAILNHNTSGC